MDLPLRVHLLLYSVQTKHHAFLCEGVDLSNCARVAAYGVYLTIFNPSAIYWMYDTLRWVVIWTIFPVQIFFYLASGGQYVTMCYSLNLAAKTCTLNIARIHFMGIMVEWSATKYAQEMLWVLAWCILASDLELAPRLIIITASTCTLICVKVWVARLYCDATITSDDRQAETSIAIDP